MNAAHMKNVPSRKTRHGRRSMESPAPRARPVTAELRPSGRYSSVSQSDRYRRALVNELARAIQRLEKALQNPGVKLISVGVDRGVKVRADHDGSLVVGVRDPMVLAELAKGRTRPKIPLLSEALACNVDQRHATIVAECLAHIDRLEASVGRISAEVAQLLEPHRWAVGLLVIIPGEELRTAEVIIAEIGSDMSVFPRSVTLPHGPGFARVTTPQRVMELPPHGLAPRK